MKMKKEILELIWICKQKIQIIKKKYDKILYYTNNTKITLIFVINVMTTLSALNPVTIQKLFNNRIWYVHVWIDMSYVSVCQLRT